MLALGVSQKVIDLAAPTAADIDLRDICHNLSHLCRYNGSTPGPYSVAAHSVYVSLLVEDSGGSPEECLAGLLHDAPEAYLGDVSSPLKSRLLGYRELESRFAQLIEAMATLHVGATCAPIVQRADHRALVFEMRHLLKYEHPGWASPSNTDHRLFDRVAKFGLESRKEFEFRYRELLFRVETSRFRAEQQEWRKQAGKAAE